MSVWIMMMLCNQATVIDMPHQMLSLTSNGEAACKVVSVIGDKPELLMRMAEKAIQIPFGIGTVSNFPCSNWARAQVNCRLSLPSS